MTFLAVVDADRIQDYIFSPRQLKLIRGASAIQRDLNLTHALELLRAPAYGPGNLNQDGNVEDLRLAQNPSQRWEVVYAGGGNIYALFRDQEDALRFASAACALYRKHGVSASATNAVVPWAENFRETLNNAQDAVMARKTSASAPLEALSSPYWKTCEACGAFPAARWIHNRVTGQRILCPACEARRANSEYAPFLNQIAPGLRAAIDFEKIAAHSRPENYLALVYLDVDKLGRFFERINPLPSDEYRRHSLRIRDSVRDGVIEGCRATCTSIPDGAFAPFEILLLGGDDAVVMLAAQSVFAFLRQFRRVFEEKTPGLSFSAGVVWAHHHLPVSQYIYHARNLLRSAKGEGGGRVDYLVVSESMVRGLSERNSERTLRPYTHEAFDNLSATIRDWKGTDFPSSKVHQLYPLAFEEECQGTLDFLYWISRLKPQHRTAACGFFEQGLWQRQPRRATGVADLAELWDFVEVA